MHTHQVTPSPFSTEKWRERFLQGAARAFARSLARASKAAIVGGSLMASGGPAVAEEAVSARLEFDKPLIQKGDGTPLYLLVRLGAAERARAGAARAPLNVALALDRSGSMADAGKLDYLKRAAVQLVDRLSRRDVLSVVEYDDEITVMWPASRIETPFAVKRLIEGLSPRGSTNLAGGMMEGVAQAARAKEDNLVPGGAVTRVMLMSDGLANQGVTDPRAIEALVRKAKAAGIAISTLGLGRDYDEDLMQTIAETGGGRYYYIENPDQMARIFALELDTLARTVAKDAALDIAAPGAQILGFAGAHAALGDLYGGESRALLVRIPVETQSIGVKRVGNLKLSYLDAESGNVHNFEAVLDVEVVDDAARAAASRNHEASVEAALAETERGQSEAVKLFESGDRSGAEMRMGALVKAVEERQSELKDKRLEKKLEALSVERGDMASAALAPEGGNEYLKRSKQRLYQAKQGQRALSLLQAGDKGYEVERLQEALAKAGYYTGPIDGHYSASLESAVKAYQQAQNLGADGIAGPATMKELGLY